MAVPVINTVFCAVPVPVRVWGRISGCLSAAREGVQVMNLTRIQYFIEVAKLENFSKAAQALYVSQPNLSKQIGLMEQELGFDLFRRVGKNVQLTRAGRYLYEQLKELPDYTAKAIAHAEALSRGDEGSLSIGVLEGQDVNFFLSGRINDLQEHYPGMTIEMERNSFRNLRQGLDRGTYDVLFTLEFELQGRDDWDSYILFKQPGAVAISRSHPLAGKENLTIDDFREEPFVAISREDSPGGYDLLLEQCARSGFTPHIVRETSTLESLFLCVEMGVGVAILDRNTRLERNDAVRLITVPDSTAAGLAAVWRKDNQNPMIQRLIAALAQRQAGDPPELRGSRV